MSKKMSIADEHSQFIKDCQNKVVLKAITTDGKEFTPHDTNESGIIYSEYYLFRAVNHQKEIEFESSQERR